MARTSSKKERKLLIKWIFTLCAALAVMACMALVLLPRSAPGSSPTPESTLPTTANDHFTYDDNGFLTCTTRASIPGIDVSHHQGTIHWEQVRAAGVEFAIIRLGYRGLQDGLLHEDEKVQQNLTGAKAAGIQIGAYFFSQATTPAEAEAEARFALDILGDTVLELPLVFDWEYVNDSARTANVSGDTLMACVRSFCSTVEQAGHKSMVYFNQDLARTRLDLDALDYPFWLAMYAEDLQFDFEISCWQYTDQGRIPGIPEKVDIDLYFP